MSDHPRLVTFTPATDERAAVGLVGQPVYLGKRRIGRVEHAVHEDDGLVLHAYVTVPLDRFGDLTVNHGRVVATPATPGPA